MATLRSKAQRIWQSGVAAVDSATLVKQVIQWSAPTLTFGAKSFNLDDIHQILVVGAGKAGAGMAEGCIQSIPATLAHDKLLTGWVNVPAESARPLPPIHLHAARPAGVNEPTAAAVVGSEEIIRLVSQAKPNDLVICLLSGGGSALLSLPAAGVTWQDKARVTQFMGGRGASIHDLNTVRKQLSRIKGGRLAQSCRADNLVTLVLSDVLGDPLDVIASGPTVPNSSSAADARQVLSAIPGSQEELPQTVWRALEVATSVESEPQNAHSIWPSNSHHLIVGNIQHAMTAAATEAAALGYEVEVIPITSKQPSAEQAGVEFAKRIQKDEYRKPTCLISGGEPTVHLVERSQRGMGGRNQQLVLAALENLRHLDRPLPNFCLLSAGTDGEDGPTDAAGAWIDNQSLKPMTVHPADYLRRNDAYRFFERTGGLWKTGPTGTNVCDLRVLLLH